MHRALLVLAQSDWNGHHHFDDGWGIGMMVVMVAFWAVIAVAIVWAVRHWTSSTHASQGSPPDEPLRILDRRLADQRYLLGNVLTEADVRLWVTLVRFDVGPNADRQIVDGLHEYPNLWAYARDLYAIPAFRDSTDFTTYGTLAAWSAPAGRGPAVQP